MNLGHFEYDCGRFLEEYERDKNRADVSPPQNFDPSLPINRWRGQRNEFFYQWLRFCHEEAHGQRAFFTNYKNASLPMKGNRGSGT